MQAAVSAVQAKATGANGKVEIKKTILLVEDEPMIRGIVSEVLERAGYRVLACAGPKEGIDACHNYDGKIDLLLTDVMMPGMNGRDMANEILKMLPQLHVVFMSGYSENALLNENGPDSHFEYLQKPFRLDTLTRTLAQFFAREITSEIAQRSDS